MPHPRQHVPDLAEILRLRGVARVVVSPGSRNAPLVDAFYRGFGEACESVVDERSAAFVALGIARRARRPVVLLCSSGSAVLNYAPALVEAKHQRVPLLAITADRPPPWIDQMDNQTIRQDGVFGDNVRRSFALPPSIQSEDDLWFAQRVANEAYNASLSPEPGPVHLNVPLEEPLYTPLPEPSGRLRLMEDFGPPRGAILPDRLAEEWSKARSILIVHGQDFAPSPSTSALERLSRDPRVAVVAENIANVDLPGIVANPELALARAGVPEPPELLVHSGGHVVSKKLKGYLRPASIARGWRVGREEGIVDTYQQVTSVVAAAAEDYYAALAELPAGRDSDYGARWLAAQAEARASRDRLLEELPFGDLVAVGMTTAALPPGSILELGNSATIRHAQFFDPRPGIECHSNRGVSGIDGSLSSAVGTAMATGRLTLCVLGDLGFVYDSNALWNRKLPEGLRIVVVNNRGGGIFSLIGAPIDTMPHRALIEAHHPVDLGRLAGAFGLKHVHVDGKASLAATLPDFLDPRGGPTLLEIETDSAVNPGAYRRMLGRPAPSN